MTQKEAQERNDKAASLGTAGLATLLVGAGAAVGGLVWWLVHESNRPQQAPAAPTLTGYLAPQPGGASGGVVLSW